MDKIILTLMLLSLSSISFAAAMVCVPNPPGPDICTVTHYTGDPNDLQGQALWAYKDWLFNRGGQAIINGSTTPPSTQPSTPTTPTPNPKCANKALTSAEIELGGRLCELDAQKTFSDKAATCTGVTKSFGTMNGGVNGGITVNGVVITGNVVITGSLNGGVEWNPQATCRLGHSDTQKTASLQCEVDAAKARAELAACP